MSYKRIPITSFIAQRYSHQSVQKIVETWPVEASEVIERLTSYFHDMGIYEVTQGSEKPIIDTMLLQLRHSPEIAKLVRHMQQEDLRRMRKLAPE